MVTPMIIAQVRPRSSAVSFEPMQFSGGSLLAALPSGSAMVDFPSMQHGFFNRGDASNPDVSAEVSRAVTEILSYFARF